jgi:peptide methionine sulfoxide reductase msrA/msrB
MIIQNKERKVLGQILGYLWAHITTSPLFHSPYNKALAQKNNSVKRISMPPSPKPLNPEEQQVILHKGTEPPFTGQFNDHDENGVYTCRQCGALLYHSSSKFKSGCGWPSFDDALPKAVKRVPDADGLRTEIVCNSCDGHLGHVFEGERMTDKNTRHCVNSISMSFCTLEELNIELATFASGCFWGTQHHLAKVPGVLHTLSGYTGGHVKNPSYQEVCGKATGHAEAVLVYFLPEQVSYETLAKLFFETHDPTQVGGQGPDLGPQYRGEVFVHSPEQKAVIEKLIAILEKDGLKVATKISEAETFWPAEEYHQDYYQKTGGHPYCHRYQKRF